VTFEIRWRPRALRDLERLDQVAQRRIVAAVERLAESGDGDVKKLQGLDPPEYRLRVGGWRVRFGRHDPERVLYVLRVLPRAEAYRS
jgi:mRNA interferase RelE/StbE